MLKAVIFDMDGVIIDSEPQHARAGIDVLKRHGVDIDKNYLEQFIGSSTRKMAEKSISDFSLNITADELLAELERAKKEYAVKEGYIAVPGVKELIIKLYQAGIHMAIASSSSTAEISDVVKSLGIRKYFDKLISSSNVENPKPAPDIFLLTLSKLGVNAKEAIVIEDSDHGVKAAKAAGIACIGYINPNSGNQSLKDADVLLESFEGLSVKFINNTLLRSQGKPLNITSTRRLNIRELSVSDVKDIYPIYKDPNIRKYIDDIDDYLDTEMEKQKAYIKNVYSFYGYGLWGVFSKTTGKLIGRCGIENHVIDGKEEIMLSYLLDSHHWGYGYAVECCEAVLKYAAEELDIKRIVAVIDYDNSRSIKTAQKIGMKCERDIIYNNRECLLYSISL
ncbi:MAG: GNAT family N-acetyltransferase [Lachnospiraceae bacterium]|nr:GNAT family N-acetyltransferase [Lachnospiraceae bacterium]